MSTVEIGSEQLADLRQTIKSLEGELDALRDKNKRLRAVTDAAWEWDSATTAPLPAAGPMRDGLYERHRLAEAALHDALATFAREWHERNSAAQHFDEHKEETK